VTETLRQRVDGLPEHALEMAPLDHAANGALFVFTGDAADLGGKLEEGQHAHVGIRRRRLGQIADLLLGFKGRRGHIETAHRDAPGGRRNEARDHPHGRGLARTVGAEEAEHFALGHLEREIVDGPFGAEHFGQILDLDHESPRAMKGRGCKKIGRTEKPESVPLCQNDGRFRGRFSTFQERLHARQSAPDSTQVSSPPAPSDGWARVNPRKRAQNNRPQHQPCPGQSIAPNVLRSEPLAGHARCQAVRRHAARAVCATSVCITLTQPR